MVFYSMYDEEALWCLDVTLINLQILLSIKERLGDLVDIQDRIFGYDSYEGNEPFLISTLAVILSLNEEEEEEINLNFYCMEEFREEFPEIVTTKFSEMDEIMELTLPMTKYHNIILELYKEKKDKLFFKYHEVEDREQILFEIFGYAELETLEQIFDFFIEVRKKAEFGGVLSD